MNNLSNSPASRQLPHRAHRATPTLSSHCSERLLHRRERPIGMRYEDLTCLSDDLELVEIRYQALRARMVLEDLFSEGTDP